MMVQVTGNFSCYPAKGRMQFSVRKIQVAGEGSLRMRVAQLAQRLQREGLMDPARKRRTPALPKRIAVITSPRGKAIKDVMRTLRRRYPLGELMVFGVPVEGADAPRYMCEALAAAQAAVPAPDVILLVRGGGSYEDLMPFNDEALARAVAACSIPVVTGIGHEPDNSIADMVADRRCSTPTAAAEAIAPSVEELARKLGNATRALNSAFTQRMEGFEHRLARLADRPLWHDQNYLLGSWAQGLDLAQERLSRALPSLLREDASALPGRAASAPGHPQRLGGPGHPAAAPRALAEGCRRRPHRRAGQAAGAGGGPPGRALAPEDPLARLFHRIQRSGPGHSQERAGRQPRQHHHPQGGRRQPGVHGQQRHAGKLAGAHPPHNGKRTRDEETQRSNTIEEMSFREGLVELDSIVKALESNQLELEQSIESYERGVALLGALKKRLDTAQQKVSVLMGELQPDEGDEIDTKLS